MFEVLTHRLVHHRRRGRRRDLRARVRPLGPWDRLEERALLAAPTLSLISANDAGTNGALVGALFPSISANGQYVAFESGSFEGDTLPAPSDLVNGLTVANDAPNVYLRNVATNTTTCLSLSINDQTPTTGDDDSRYPIISANGNTVVFLSNATDLTANDNPTNNPSDNQNVFAWTRATNKVTLLTVNYEGTAPGNDPDTSNGFGTAENISVSANGQFVAFDSEATDLVPNATNIDGFTPNVYVRDLVTNKTILVSASTAGIDTGGNGSSNEPAISADGSTVAFESQASNLDPSYAGPPFNGNYQIYASTLGPNDTVSATKLVTVDPTGTTAGDGGSEFPSLSDNGQMVAFQSSASNLVNTPNGGSFNDVYVRNLATSTTQLVSVDDMVTDPATGDSSSFTPQISGDGNHVLFYSYADNLTNNDTNGNPNVFERNLTTETTQLVSVSDDGSNGGDDTSELANTTFVNLSQKATGQISDNGQYVIFLSVATDLVPNFDQMSGGAPFGTDLYLRDTVGETTTLISHQVETTSTGGTGESGRAVITPDGTAVAFQSAFPGAPDNLVSNDTNGQTQLFDAELSPVATTITATAGSSQSATVNTAFATALQATVKDQNGNPFSGATVTFTAPSSGAHGTFAGGLTTVMETTNSNGVATAPTFTANGTAGGYTVTASVSGVATPASFSLTNTAVTPVATTITATAGTPQSATVNTVFATALEATVRDQNGSPFSGATVTFTAPSSGAHGTFPGGLTTVMETTNASGVATAPTFTANGTAGGYTVTASVSGVATPASFSLTNTAVTPVATTITATAGTPQSAMVNTAFATALQATVRDQNGNPFSGATVTFTAPSGSAHGTFPGGLTTVMETTNSSGVATAPTLTANGTAGGYTVTASVAGVPTTASFSLTNSSTAVVATTISATAGTPQSATVNTAFATALQATVRDQNGNPFSGATVTFTAPTSGAHGTFPGGLTTVMETTNSSGVATAPALTANGTVGGYTVTASVAGVATPASFSLTNTAAAVATGITAVGGTGTYGGNAILTATLSTNGTPLAGKSVAFTLSIGGTVTPVGSATTGANGVATLTGVSLSGFRAGTASAAVGASFAGDSTDDPSNGSGTLTVSQVTPTINWPAPGNITSGTALGATQLDATASVPGNFAYSPAAGTVLSTGQGQLLSVTFTPIDTTDYAAATGSTTINVLLAPQVMTIAPVSSRKGLTSVTVDYNEPLNSSSASNSGLYHVFAAVTKVVKRHKETVYTKALKILGVSPNGSDSTVTIKLAKAYKGTVQVTVQGTITAANGASNSVNYPMIVK